MRRFFQPAKPAAGWGRSFELRAEDEAEGREDRAKTKIIQRRLAGRIRQEEEHDESNCKQDEKRADAVDNFFT